MNIDEALDTAISALLILHAQECSENLTPTLKKKCEERRKSFRKAIEVLKDFKTKKEMK